MIEFSHVYKTFAGPTHALKNVSFEIEKGEFVFLTGPSGAGKTTLFKMLSAFDRPTSGKVFVGSNEISNLQSAALPMFRSRIGIVYQDFKLLKQQNVWENIALPLRVRGDRQIQIARRVSEVLEQVGLDGKAETLVEVLSGGEQQRVAIARALIHRPGLLIADEPTGNLDPERSEEIIDLLEHMCAQGTTVLIATHDHNLVQRRKKRRIDLLAGELSGDQR